MIWNIIGRPYRWKKVNAIIEAVEHDNSCADADQAPETLPLQVIDYDKPEGVSIADALAWANTQRCPVTLYPLRRWQRDNERGALQRLRMPVPMKDLIRYHYGHIFRGIRKC